MIRYRAYKRIGQVLLTAKSRQENFDRYPQVDAIMEYPGGFVSNSYAPKREVLREGWITYRNGVRHARQMYDAKRAYGIGPRWTALNERSYKVVSETTWKEK